jgi:hypothetical protein
MTTATKSVNLGGRRVPVVLPNRRDPRLHTAAVIISVHVVGVTALGFRVSAPQILVAIMTAGLIDVALTYRNSGRLVWPASGMLTGSGVALILRLVGMGRGDYWSFSGLHWFALVAGVSIATKYLIRLGGSHVFNPSNIGLVLAFLIIGSDIVEPLDFWWAPIGPWMVLAYLIIIGGGVVITRRLRLLEMAVVFWVVLAAGLGVLAASGHCMTAAWSPTAVCDGRFWTVLVTSPEIMIFLFFMITDPKTIPRGRAARVAFATTLGLFTALMIAPHSVEYGAKVGLLASLALWSPLSRVFERVLPETDGVGSGVGEMIRRAIRRPPVAVFTRGAAFGVILVLTAGGIVAAGLPAREAALAVPAQGSEVDVDIDVGALPDVEVGPSTRSLDLDVDAEFVDQLAVTLAENLALEAAAIREADGSLLGLADGASRLDEMQERLDEAIATGERRFALYTFDSLALDVHEAAGSQSSAGLVFSGEGSVDRVVHDAFGDEQGKITERFTGEFVLRQLAGDRWLLVSVAETS